MKKIVTLTGIAAVLALSGCAVPGEPPVIATDTIEQAAPAEVRPAVASPDYEEYMFDLNSAYPGWAAYGDAYDAMGLGDSTCEMFDNLGVDAAMEIVRAPEYIPLDLSLAVAASAGINLCPAHEAALADWAGVTTTA